MKKSLIIFLTVLLFSCSSNSDNTDTSSPPSPEPNESDLSQYIIECSDFVKFSKDSAFLLFLISKGYDLNNDFKISCEEALKITSLDLGSKGAGDLIGIEYLQNLKTLSGKVNLDQFKFNTLNLYNNYSLEEIDFNVAPTNIPIIILPKNSKLKTLNCYGGGVKKLLNLAEQKQLKVLNLKYCSLQGNIDLSKNNVIESINLSNNSVTSITFSTEINTSLKELNVGSANINMGFNHLTSINLKTFPNLEKLILSSNGLQKLDIANNSKLNYLDISFNSIPKMDFSNNRDIKILNINNNRITFLELENLPNLQILDAKNNLFENLDFSNSKNLNALSLDNNDLKTLNIKNGRNSFMTRVSVLENKINCIIIDNNFTPNPNKWFKDSNTKYCN